MVKKKPNKISLHTAFSTIYTHKIKYITGEQCLKTHNSNLFKSQIFKLMMNIFFSTASKELGQGRETTAKTKLKNEREGEQTMK